MMLLGVACYYEKRIADMPNGIRLLLPPGFRDDGYYMNGVPVDTDMDAEKLFALMRPYRLYLPRNVVTPEASKRYRLTLVHARNLLADAVFVCIN